MDDYIVDELETPFQPEYPVKPEYFKGRTDIIKKILRYLNKSLKGEVQHFFLTGNKGMGKTSIADFIIKFVTKKYNMTYAYVSNKGNDSVDKLASNIMKELLEKVPEKSFDEKLKSWFGTHVSEIQLMGTKINFNIDREKENNIKENFPKYLSLAFSDLKEVYDGIFIIIDDINGLSESTEFVDWYKNLSDTLSINYKNELPVYFLLEGYPEKFDNMVELEASFGRIFHYAHVDALSDEEVESFYNDTLEKIGISIDEKALSLMVEYASGVPLTMQQIGDCVFWKINSKEVELSDAKQAVIEAGEELKNKQLRRLLNRIEISQHEQLLMKLGYHKLSSFKYDDLKNLTNNHELINDFIANMLNLNILKETQKKQYEFNNKLYYTYFNIKSSTQKIFNY